MEGKTLMVWPLFPQEVKFPLLLNDSASKDNRQELSVVIENSDERGKTTILLSKLLIDSFWIKRLQSKNNAQPYIEDYWRVSLE